MQCLPARGTAAAAAVRPSCLQQRRQAAPQPPTLRLASAAGLSPGAPRPTLWQRRQRQHLQPATASAAAAAAAPAIDSSSSSSSTELPPPPPAAATRQSAYALAVETLRPDWPLLLVTTGTLVATIAFTLLFPLAIGEVFDVVRAQGSLAAGDAASSAAAAAVNPFTFSAASATPPSFRAAMLKLSACLVLSATGNALVSYFSTLLGERFGYRLKARLMQASAARRRVFLCFHIVLCHELLAKKRKRAAALTAFLPCLPACCCLQTLMAKDQAFFDATAKGDLVSRLTLDVTVLQATLAGERRCRLRLLLPAACSCCSGCWWLGCLQLCWEGCLLPTAPAVRGCTSLSLTLPAHPPPAHPPPPPPHPPFSTMQCTADFIGQRGFRSMFEVVGALLVISVQQPLLALVSIAITPLLSRLLRSVVVRSSAIIYRRQQVRPAGGGAGGGVGGAVWPSCLAARPRAMSQCLPAQPHCLP